ncbi:phage repressor protein CI [Vibrio alginolyticus]|uniref:phage repressor protein CI n=1 Tax=Vibrio alginolyticus TaxID=663 RepID=UPI0003648A03|nr:phage repressor protein CI [Vibrio alginolyticus]ELA9729602.1 phage repressor protein CI [Vibrio alginolyticus]ELB2903510.1 phage repressor protein CI [Vibrio alginolyticus]
MSRIPAKVPPFEYKAGRSFTDRLKEVTGCRSYDLLADYYGVPKSTIFTWHQHDRIAHELIVREHLHSGASVKFLALGEGEAFPNGRAENLKDIIEQPTPTTKFITKFSIGNGELTEIGNSEIGLSTLNDFGLAQADLIIIDKGETHHYVNKAERQPVSGDYLIEIDGVISINYLQRLPGKKLAIAFDTSTIEVSEQDIKVLGRVAMEMKKK